MLSNLYFFSIRISIDKVISEILIFYNFSHFFRNFLAHCLCPSVDWVQQLTESDFWVEVKRSKIIFVINPFIGWSLMTEHRWDDIFHTNAIYIEPHVYGNIDFFYGTIDVFQTISASIYKLHIFTQYRRDRLINKNKPLTKIRIIKKIADIMYE